MAMRYRANTEAVLQKSVDLPESGQYIAKRKPNRGKYHTPGHVRCPACANADKLLTQEDADLSALPFRDASPIWIEIRRQRPLRDRTHEATRGYFNALEKFFGDVILRQIRPGHLREYQLARKANLLRVDAGDVSPWKQCAGNSMINHELNALSLLLRHCRLWGELKPYYHPLPVNGWSPRDVLSDENEQKLFDLGASDPSVSLAYWVAAISNNTSATGCELRGLRLKHVELNEPVIDKWGVDLNPSSIYIPEDAVKNDSRPRKIPLNRTAKWAVQQCYNRALLLGACQPDHFLFPFRVKRNCYDPTRRPSRWWIRDNWNKLRELAGMPNLRPHDMRHQCITRMLEAGANRDTVMAIAGHVTEEMLEYYSHIRVQAKISVLDAIDPHAYRVAKPMGVVRALPVRAVR